MDQVIAFLLLGLGSGGLIAGTGVGVVLSYRGSGLINVSCGAIAMLSGFLYWTLTGGEVNIGTPLALIAVLVFAVLLGVAFEYGLARPLRRQAPIAKLVASLGFLLSAQAAVILAFGEAARQEPAILPANVVTVLGLAIPVNRFWVAAIVAVVIVALALGYRYTRFGLGTRASAENEANAMMAGLSPNWYSLANTVFMSVLMALVGLLSASIEPVDSSTLPLVIVPALAAAMFGRLTSFTVTLVAGLALGMIESLITYLSTFTWFPHSGVGIGSPIPGVQELVEFVLLVIAMFVRGGRIPSRGDIVDRKLPAAPMPKAPMRSMVKWGGITAVAIYVLPFGYREGLITSLIEAIALLSLVVITGYVGQLSVVQLALGGVAGFTVSHFAVSFGIGFPWAALVGVAFAIIIGVASGFPALRVRGVGLVVVTLAATNAIENFGFANNTWGAGSAGSPVTAPKLFGFNFGPNGGLTGLDGGEPSPYFGWFCLLVLTAVGLFCCNLRRSTLGREMIAVRANERAAAAIGINIRNIKLIGFGLSSGLAGISGVLLAYSYGSIDANSYSLLLALGLIAFGYIIGITTVPGAIWAAIGVPGGLLAYCLLAWFGLQGNWINFVGGFLLIATLIHRPDGVAIYALYGPPKPPMRERRLARLVMGGRAPQPAGLTPAAGEAADAATTVPAP